MKKTKVKTNKPVYLGMSILDISKTLTYEFWYDYVKPKTKQRQSKIMDTWIWIQIALLVIVLLKIFLKTLTMILKDDLIHLTMIRMTKDHFQWV